MRTVSKQIFIDNVLPIMVGSRMKEYYMTQSFKLEQMELEKLPISNLIYGE